jgi:hypothetical protein
MLEKAQATWFSSGSTSDMQFARLESFYGRLETAARSITGRLRACSGLELVRAEIERESARARSRYVPSSP